MSLRDVAPIGGGSFSPGLVIRPHPLFILIEPLGHYGAIVLVGLIALLASLAWSWMGLGGAPGWEGVAAAALMLVLLRLLWATADWATRSYGLSSGLVWSERGVLSRRRDELPADRLRSMVLVKPIVQRVFGLGSIGFATAGTGGYEVVWFIISRPAERLELMRAARPRLEEAA